MSSFLNTIPSEARRGSPQGITPRKFGQVNGEFKRFTTRATIVLLAPVPFRSNRFSSAQASGVESRIALRGDPTPCGGQATDNIALRARNDALAKTARVSVTCAYNIERQCTAPFGKFVLVLLKALENIIRLHGYAAALLLDCIAASNRGPGLFCVSKVVVDTKN
jgi:hypothetical protein